MVKILSASLTGTNFYLTTSWSSTTTSTASYDPISSDTERNNVVNRIKDAANAGSTGSNALLNTISATGKITINNTEYQIVSVSGYRANSSSATLYINYWDSANSVFATESIAYTAIDGRFSIRSAQ